MFFKNKYIYIVVKELIMEVLYSKRYKNNIQKLIRVHISVLNRVDFVYGPTSTPPPLFFPLLVG